MGRTTVLTDDIKEEITRLQEKQYPVPPEIVNALTNDLSSVNYSSLRAGALEDREMYRLYQRFVIDHFVRPVF